MWIMRISFKVLHNHLMVLTDSSGCYPITAIK